MRQYVAKPGQKCKSELIVGAELELGFPWDRVCVVKPGYASKNKWCLRCLLKIGNVKAEEIWAGSLFETWDADAVDEEDFEVVIDVFLNGSDMVMEVEDCSDRESMHLERIWARYKGCWWYSTLKAVVAILKLIRWRTGSQWMPAGTGVMWQYRDFCAK